MSDDDTPVPSPPLVQAIGDQLQRSHVENVKVSHESLKSLINDWLEAHEADLAALVRPHVEALANDPTVPDHLRSLYSVLASPEHQTQFFTALFAISGIINQFVGAAVQPWVQDIANTAWRGKQSMPLSAADVALAKLRNTLGQLDPYNEAAATGIDQQRLDILELNTGEPPGLMQVLELARRDELHAGDLEKAVRQSRVRDEWLYAVEALTYTVPSPAEVIRGLVQNHLGLEEAVRKYKEAGYKEENFGWQYETAGRPPGIMEMNNLLNRREISEDDVRQAIRESDIKDKYIDAILKLRVHLLPQRTIKEMIHHGVISDEDATIQLQDIGLAPDNIARLIKEGHASKMAAPKELAVSTVKALYADRLIDHAQAVNHLGTIGYDANEAGFILQLVDVAREQRYVTAAITKFHSLFVRYHLNASEVTTRMDALGVGTEEREDLIKLWTLEREANRPRFTLAQIDKALKKGAMTEEQYRDHATALGWAQEDIDILLKLI